MFAQKILYYWVGEDFARQGTHILQILALTYFVLALYNPLINFLLGMGKVKFLTYASVSLAIFNMVLVLCLVPRYGILGAAWAYFFSVLPIIYIFYYVEKHFLGLVGIGSFYAKLYGKIILTALIFMGICRELLVPLASGFWGLIIIGPLSILLYFFIYWLFRFVEEEDMELFKRTLVLAKNKFLN